MTIEESVVLDDQGLLAPALARGWVAERTDGLPRDTVQDALLVVSELVTNAVRHGRPVVELRLRRDPDCLWLAVSDGGHTMPMLPTARPAVERTTGRGLLIVAATASRWGVDQRDDQLGKTVWVTLEWAG